MRKIVLLISVSLDGFMEGPDHDLSWHRVDDEVHEHFNDVLGRMSAFLEGRVTFELMDAYWPAAADDPDSAPVEVAFARIWREMPKVVYSRTLEQVSDPTATIVRDVVPEEVAALKAQPGGDMVVGGPQLASEFLRLGLVDEVRIYVHPVLVGDGTRVFPHGFQAEIDLVETRRFGTGVVLLRYEVRAATT